jgi:predicted transcriptional regulator
VVSAVLMSIKPTYAEAIFNGTKTVELRRKRPSFEPGTTVLVYSSSPNRALEGAFETGEVIALAPRLLWRKVSRRAGVDRATFDSYFDGCDLAFAIEVINPRRIKKSRLTFRPPQSYLFLRRGRRSHERLLRFAAASI